ncbi:hypothetical protein ACQ4PT_017594 [Festuca glaucescens]
MVDGAQLSRGGHGTFGYMDPYMGGQLSEKIDIYSFGVILLELISGREAIHDGPEGVPSSIVTWMNELIRFVQARPQIESGDVEAIIDVSLDAGYKPDSVRMIGDLAIRCVGAQDTQRPSSSDIVREIEEAVRVELQLEAPQQMPQETADSDDSQGLESSQIFHEMINQ